MDFFPHTHAKQQVLQPRWRITRICLQQSHTEEHGSHQYQLMCFWNGPDDTYQFCSQQENIRCDQHRGIFTHTQFWIQTKRTPWFSSCCQSHTQLHVPGKGTIAVFFAAVDFYCSSGYIRPSSGTISTSHRLPSLLITSSSKQQITKETKFHRSSSKIIIDNLVSHQSTCRL